MPSHLCDLILSHGHDVIGIDNFLTGHARNIAHLTREPRFRFIEADVCQPLPELGGVDCVIHAASPASPKDYYDNPIETLDVGSIGSRNLLELARANNARYLVTSTSECYGDPLEHPQVETYWGNVNPVGPRSCYDESKRFAEAITMAYHRKYGLRTNIARIFNTYGPRMLPDDGRVVSNFILQALRAQPLTLYGDGSQTRSFCYVDDLVEGLIRLMNGEHTGPMNLGNPGEFTIRQLAELVRDRINPGLDLVFEPLPQDDPLQRQPVIALAEQQLGWQPTIPLQQGLEPTIAYFRERLAD